MKKRQRFLSFLLVCLLCLSFCGCKALDEARASHGFLQDDSSILLGDVYYKPLPACEQLSPVFTNCHMVYVTAPDVPVLLSGFLGEQYYRSDDGLFLREDFYNGITYYCRQDRYDEVAERINNGVTLDGYCYSYWSWEEDCLKTYCLTDAQVQAVESVYTTVEPSVLFEGAALEYQYSIWLDACSEDLLFREERFEVCVVGSAYYIVVYGTDTTLYAVPAELNDVFTSMLSAAIAAEGYTITGDYCY